MSYWRQLSNIAIAFALISGAPSFAQTGKGDVVYVPKARYHRASFGGQGMATRLAINGYPDGLHNYRAPD